MVMDPRIKAGIFAGESGGDYDALFGFSNRPGGKFAGNKLTGMTVDQAIAFADPNGPYGQWVKSQIGRVATPMGGYQIVGSTLRDAKKWLKLTGNEMMTPELQDKLGEVILAKQGTGAYAGYKGPRADGQYGLKRHVGGAGSSAGYFGDQPTTTVAGGDNKVTDPSLDGGKKDKPKTWNEKLGAGLKDFADTMGGSQPPPMMGGQAPVEFSSAQATPSVYRTQLAPTMVQGGAGSMGGGQDMRALLAMLMQQGGLG